MMTVFLGRLLNLSPDYRKRVQEQLKDDSKSDPISTKVENLHALTHKETIDIVQYIQENRSSALEGITKTKTRGVLALMKHAGAIDSFTPVGDSVQITFSGTVASFEQFRCLHDNYLKSAAVDCDVELSTKEWNSLIWDAAKRRNILAKCTQEIKKLRLSLDNLPKEFLSNLAMQSTPSADEENLSQSFSSGDGLANLLPGLAFGYDSCGSSEFSFRSRQQLFRHEADYDLFPSTASTPSGSSLHSHISALTQDSPIAGLTPSMFVYQYESSEIEESKEGLNAEEYIQRSNSQFYSLFPEENDSPHEVMSKTTPNFNDVENKDPITPPSNSSTTLPLGSISI